MMRQQLEDLYLQEDLYQEIITSSGLQEKQIFKDHNEIFQRRAFAWTPAQEREVQGQAYAGVPMWTFFLQCDCNYWTGSYD